MRVVPRTRDVLLHPVNLIPFAVCGLFAILSYYGYIANSLWLDIGALLSAMAVTMAFTLAFPPESDRAKPVLHLGIEIAVIGVIIYVIGWGSIFAVGFVFAAISHMNRDGSHLGRPAMLFSTLAIVCGEIVIALGWIGSMQPEPEGHVLAILELAGILAVIWITSYSLREKEAIDAELLQSEERLRALVEYASDAILVIDAERYIQYASPAVERLLGYAPASFTRFDTSLFHEDFMDSAVATFVDATQRPGEVVWFEMPIRHRDGTFHWFEIGITNRLDDPAVNGFVCNLRDITERREAQHELTFQAHHDALTPASQSMAVLRPARARAARKAVAPRRLWLCSSSTSTGSSS